MMQLLKRIVLKIATACGATLFLFALAYSVTFLQSVTLACAIIGTPIFVIFSGLAISENLPIREDVTRLDELARVASWIGLFALSLILILAFMFSMVELSLSIPSVISLSTILPILLVLFIGCYAYRIFDSWQKPPSFQLQLSLVGQPMALRLLRALYYHLIDMVAIAVLSAIYFQLSPLWIIATTTLIFLLSAELVFSQFNYQTVYLYMNSTLFSEFNFYIKFSDDQIFCPSYNHYLDRNEDLATTFNSFFCKQAIQHLYKIYLSNNPARQEAIKAFLTQPDLACSHENLAGSATDANSALLLLKMLLPEETEVITTADRDFLDSLANFGFFRRRALAYHYVPSLSVLCAEMRKLEQGTDTSVSYTDVKLIRMLRKARAINQSADNSAGQYTNVIARSDIENLEFYLHYDPHDLQLWFAEFRRWYPEPAGCRNFINRSINETLITGFTKNYSDQVIALLANSDIDSQALIQFRYKNKTLVENAILLQMNLQVLAALQQHGLSLTQAQANQFGRHLITPAIAQLFGVTQPAARGGQGGDVAQAFADDQHNAHDPNARHSATLNARALAKHISELQIDCSCPQVRQRLFRQFEQTLQQTLKDPSQLCTDIISERAAKRKSNRDRVDQDHRQAETTTQQHLHKILQTEVMERHLQQQFEQKLKLKLTVALRAMGRLKTWLPQDGLPDAWRDRLPELLAMLIHLCQLEKDDKVVLTTPQARIRSLVEALCRIQRTHCSFGFNPATQQPYPDFYGEHLSNDQPACPVGTLGKLGEAFHGDLAYIQLAIEPIEVARRYMREAVVAFMQDLDSQKHRAFLALWDDDTRPIGELTTALEADPTFKALQQAIIAAVEPLTHDNEATSEAALISQAQGQAIQKDIAGYVFETRDQAQQVAKMSHSAETPAVLAAAEQFPVPIDLKPKLNPVAVIIQSLVDGKQLSSDQNQYIIAHIVELADNIRLVLALSASSRYQNLVARLLQQMPLSTRHRLMNHLRSGGAEVAYLRQRVNSQFYGRIVAKHGYNDDIGLVEHVLALCNGKSETHMQSIQARYREHQQQLQHGQSINLPCYYHATREPANVASMINAGISMDHRGSFPGAFFSTKPESAYGNYVIALDQRAVEFQARAYKYITNQNGFWVGLGQVIDLRDPIALTYQIAYVIVPTKDEIAAVQAELTKLNIQQHPHIITANEASVERQLISEWRSVMVEKQWQHPVEAYQAQAAASI